MIVEIARHVLGIEDADHAETSPEAERLVITPLTCSIAGTEQAVRYVPGTLAHSCAGADRAVEEFWCNYGLNADYLARLEAAGLRASAFDDRGEVRVAEWTGHPFFLATLFLPQKRSHPEAPHPLLVGFARAVERHAPAAIPS